MNEIVQQVKEHCDPPYRPVVPSDSVPGKWLFLMEKCWKEDPREQATLDNILLSLQSIDKGVSGNLVDKVIKRLESIQDT